MSAQQRSPYLLLAVTMMLWGGAFSSSEAVVDHVPHTVAATLRFGGGAVALLIAAALTGRGGGRGRGGRGGRGSQGGQGSQRPAPRPKVGVRASARACLAGVLGVFAYNGFFFWGLSLAPSLDGGILIPVMSPVLTTSFLLISGREKASRRRLIGLALGLAGAAAYLIGANSAGGGSHRLLGDLLYVLSAVCWAAFTLAAPKVLAGIEPLTAMAYATCTGAILLALVAAPDLGRVQWSALPAEVWLNVAYLAIGATAVANVLYYRGVAAVGPASASLMMFLVPAVNTACATLFLGESFTGVQAAGAVVLLVGAALAGRARISSQWRRPAERVRPALRRRRQATPG